MENLSKILLAVHVFSGFTSLALFWIPMFTRKGGLNHRRIGKIYVYLMSIVVITAALLCLVALTEGRFIGASFLGFLSLITGQAVWEGVAILNTKKGFSRSFLWTQKLFQLSTFSFGLALLITGLVLINQGFGVVMLIFGILGISNFSKVWNIIRGRDLEQKDWFNGHLEGMIISGIAAYTAFFVFGGRQFLGNIFTGYWMVVPWVAPTVIGIFSIRYLKKYYARKKAKKLDPTT
ncbi:MAG: hypothetical protein AAGG75_09435 [Bacteroidota bacterium]